MEISYTNGIKFSFRELRRQREMIINYIHDVKMQFKDFLSRPDKKQPLLDSFQKEYNEIDDDYRHASTFGLNLKCRMDAELKAELHQRVEDLREKLWEQSDIRKQEAETERVAWIENKWAEDQFITMCNAYIALFQLEVDRYVATKQVVLDFTREANEMVTYYR